jgi:phosphatidylinositol-3-phosphatase
MSATGACPDCGSPLVSGQRYCVSCGTRLGARDPQLTALLARVRESAARTSLDAHPAAAAGATADRTPPANGSRKGGQWLSLPPLSLPPRWVSALLIAAFLGFGVVVGGAASSGVNDTLAASRRAVAVVLPPASAPSPSSTSTSSSPPAAEAQATPSSGGEAQAAGAGANADASGSSTGAPPKGSANGSGKSASGSSGGGSTGAGGASGSVTKLSSFKHVFVVMLDDVPYASAFGPESSAHYLATTLESKGILLPRYYAVAHQQLADTVALVSGQGPTAQTAQNCPTYEAIAPGTVGGEEQVSGSGCIYPSATQALPAQLRAKQLSFRAYIQGIDEGAATPPACPRPALGTADPNAGATPAPGQTYASFANPFVYFKSLAESPACEAEDVGLSQLAGDLASPSRTPSFAYIAPDRCHDGNPTPCAPGVPAGMVAANSFLAQVIPEILAAKAYKEDGLLVVTADQAPSSGELADSSSCCAQPQFPNLPATNTGLAPEGGGQVGALLLSPLIKTHSVSQEPYNHFSLLRTIEDIFGLGHLGYAAGAKVSAFSPSLFAGGGGG